MAVAAIRLTNLSKSFVKGPASPEERVARQYEQGEMVALIGASGSGKSTLIRTVAGLLRIDATAMPGEIRNSRRHVMQKNGRVSRRRQAAPLPRRRCVPAIQSGAAAVGSDECVLRFSRTDPRTGAARSAGSRREKSSGRMQALARVGIAEQALKRGSELSGGQQQRAAIARSLVQGSEILIADEPIASLDPSSARRVMDILARPQREDGITVLVSLHQVEYALNYCPRTIALRDGEVVYDGPSIGADAGVSRRALWR